MGSRLGAGQEPCRCHPVPHRCAQQLLQHGASVNSRTEEEEDTALHVAARHGLTDHVQLLLRHGAELEAKNEEGQTPLNAACAQPHQPQDTDRYYRVCQLLVESGASINAADRDRQHPLHLACKNANARVAELLLARGANVNIMNYSGNTALHNILQAAAYKLEHHPELVVRTLLNYGAVRIWPGSLLKVRSSPQCWRRAGREGCEHRAKTAGPAGSARGWLGQSRAGLAGSTQGWSAPAHSLSCPSLPGGCGRGTGVTGKGFLEVFSWVCSPVGLSCFCPLGWVDSTYAVSISPCPGKRWPVSSQGLCFLFGTCPPALAVSARHWQMKG